MSLHKEYCIQWDSILQAHQRIQTFAYKTPVLTSSSVNILLSPPTSSSNQQQGEQQQFFFKVEAMQRTGSFKFRGALNAILSIVEQVQKEEEDGPGKPVSISIVTHSSGNHAAAIACAAEIASSFSSIPVNATIVMPRNVTMIKKRAVEEYRGEIILVDNTNEARESMAESISQERGAYFVHPSEDPRVIAGQGTVGVEFVSQVRDLINGDLDLVIIPVGGGGLASGNTIALRALLGDKVKIVLAEPEVMNDAKRSKDAGTLLGHDKNNPLNSVADGLKTTLGPNTWPIVRDLVDDIITVSEMDILLATKFVWERLKVCIEPSAGVGVAVAMSKEFHQKYSNLKKVGVILCGGNVDVIKLTDMMKESNFS